MSHPAYKPSSAFSTKAKVAKGGGGGYLRDTTVFPFFIHTCRAV